ncbi:MAG: hypothetical protein H6732_09860 [Alphaproteobacteria bacterium]|nr:hypothetical protein [Alphaproteobacteria bacterium]
MLALLLTLGLGEAADLDATYDRLRDRLSDFVVVGTAQGESIPAGWRHDGLGLAKWADATVALGWYVGLLATERALLVEEGEDPAATDLELATALRAVVRLDRVADAAFPPPCTQTEVVNGFFVRDDVPADFHTRFDGLSVLQSDWIDGEKLKEQSQDQVLHLLPGLGLVRRLVPADVVVDGLPLREAATAQALLLLEHVADGGDWVVRNPACENRPVARGAQAIGFSPAFAAAYRWFTDDEADLPDWEDQDVFFQTLQNPDHAIFLNPDNRHLTMAGVAVGGAFGDATMPALVAIAQPDSWVAYPLLHAVLHGPVPGWAEARADLLGTATAMLEELGDAEPAGFAEGSDPGHRWTTWHRFIRPKATQDRGEGEGKRFSGLDWLLLRNLVLLAPPEEAVDTAVVDTAGAQDDTDLEAEEAGCACAQGGVRGGWVWVVLGVLGWRRGSRHRGTEGAEAGTEGRVWGSVPRWVGSAVPGGVGAGRGAGGRRVAAPRGRHRG